MVGEELPSESFFFVFQEWFTYRTADFNDSLTRYAMKSTIAETIDGFLAHSHADLEINDSFSNSTASALRTYDVFWAPHWGHLQSLGTSLNATPSPQVLRQSYV